MRRSNARRVKGLALSRIAALVNFAVRYYSLYPDYAVTAVRTAQRIAMKYRVRLPTGLRRRFCRKCGTPFTGPSTFTIRVRRGRTRHVTLRCLKCGYVRRFQFRVKNKPLSKSSGVTGVG